MTPEETLHEIKRLFDQNKTDAQIAAALSKKTGQKVSPKNVQGTRRLMRWNIPIKPPVTKVKIDEEFVLREFDERLPHGHEEEIEFTKEMAARLQYDYRTVRRVLLDGGRVKARPVTPYPQEVWNHAKMLLEDGMSYGRVSKETGISQTSLGKRFPGYGIKPE